MLTLTGRILATVTAFGIRKMSVRSAPLTLDMFEKRMTFWLKPPLYSEPWDNVGILVGSVVDKEDKVINTVFLCNDLTPPVMEEAINVKADVIVTYHPLLFKPIKTVAYNTWNERVVAKAIAHDIVVYSPHTALDSVPGGVNDHFIHILGLHRGVSTLEPICPKGLPRVAEAKGEPSNPSEIVEEFGKIFESAMKFGDEAFVGFHLFNDNPGCRGLQVSVGNDIFPRPPVASQPNEWQSPSPTFWPGSGRCVVLKEPTTLGELVILFKDKFGAAYVQVGGNGDPNRSLSRIGICAGSGASLLKSLPYEVDCFMTGEMSHHEILEYVHSGKTGCRTVILFGHCTSERHYLPILAESLRIVLNIGNKAPKILVSAVDQSPLVMR